MRLETERLVLRPLSLDDLDALAPFFADPDVMRYMGGKTLTRDETEASIYRMVGPGSRPTGSASWPWYERTTVNYSAAAEYSSGKPSRGSRSREPRRTVETETEIGYALGQPYWGQGYATEAAIACRDYARNELGRDRLISLIAPETKRSPRSREKLGK